MNGAIQWMLPALAVCLVLSGIHVYLGYHVVKRGVIFVDLSLSQLAAFGSAVAMVAGFEGGAAWGVSLAFALGGAVLFSLFRRVEVVPVEALIGITYAAAIALSLLVLEHSPTGAEEVKEMLVGTLFTVTWMEIGRTAVLYACVGLLHWVLRRQILASTEGHAGAKGGFWDLVFYSSLALVVTSSVHLAGVLLVFSLLVIPAVAATLAVRGIVGRIGFGWGFAGLACVLGLWASFRFDLPAGPSVVAALVGLLVFCSAVAAIRKKSEVAL